MSCILCHYTPALTIWKNTRLIMGLNHKQDCFCKFLQHGLIDSLKWLHHDERRDAACCHSCLKVIQRGLLTSSNTDPAFPKNWFSNWKNRILLLTFNWVLCDLPTFANGRHYIYAHVIFKPGVNLSHRSQNWFELPGVSRNRGWNYRAWVKQIQWKQALVRDIGDNFCAGWTTKKLRT